MNCINSCTYLIELLPQAAVMVHIQTQKITFANRVANKLFCFNGQATPTMEQIVMHIPVSTAVCTAVKQELQATGQSIIRHVRIQTAAQHINRYDIHITYVDETRQSVYLIFAISENELQRMLQQNLHYSTISQAAYSYPFHLDIKAKRMEFFNPIFETDYHMPMVMENFPEPVFQYNYLYEDDVEEYRACIDRMYKGESPKGSFRFYDVKGEPLRYSVNYVVHRNADGQPIEVDGDFILQSPAQNILAYKEKLQQTVHECIDIMFAVGATGQDPQVAYTSILNQVKDYYNADGAYFYKFVRETRKIERVHTVFHDNLAGLEKTLPMVINEEELKLMELLSEAKTEHIEGQLQSFSQGYKANLLQQQQDYNIHAFACVSIKNVAGETVGFLGVINPKYHHNNKEFLEQLSRPICMFIEFQREQRMKKELVKLEASSKANVIKQCVENFREFAHCKDHIANVLDSLCDHYDADVAVTLTGCAETGDYAISNIGGSAIPNFEELEHQPAYAMKKWEKIFQNGKHFITDSELDNPEAKQLLKEKFGVRNFIAAPIQDEHGVLTGLLYVMNYKALKRSNLLTHIVANNISAYLDKIHLYEQKHLEPMTKLSDKVATKNQITEYLEDGTKGALFIIDIDHFKQLNDTLGHQFGDRAIITLADNIKKAFRSSDVIGRVGGDEFMVFCPHLTEDDLIHNKAQQLLKKCNLQFEKDGVVANVTASIGICRVDNGCNTFQSLYERADEVLYISKNNGKNQYHIYADKER